MVDPLLALSCPDAFNLAKQQVDCGVVLAESVTVLGRLALRPARDFLAGEATVAAATCRVRLSPPLGFLDSLPNLI